VKPNRKRQSVLERRATLAVEFARQLLGDAEQPGGKPLVLCLRAGEFQVLFRERYASKYPDLVHRSESSLERARLERRKLPHLPRVILKQGAPRKQDREPLS
jgi:hypothetical protein